MSTREGSGGRPIAANNLWGCESGAQLGSLFVKRRMARRDTGEPMVTLQMIARGTLIVARPLHCGSLALQWMGHIEWGPRNVRNVLGQVLTGSEGSG